MLFTPCMCVSGGHVQCVWWTRAPRSCHLCTGSLKATTLTLSPRMTLVWCSRPPLRYNTAPQQHGSPTVAHGVHTMISTHTLSRARMACSQQDCHFFTTRWRQYSAAVLSELHTDFVGTDLGVFLFLFCQVRILTVIFFFLG